MNDGLTEPPSDLLYGLAAIAKHLSLTVPQVKHMAASARLPTFKVGQIVCARRSALAKHFAEQEKAASNG